ncbi:MAG TPA: molybdenum cofactor guanylyltransferase [Syntrophus sp. (in: bacteria)]|jgi:molybdopterin-guanine dinucleotide biosynthesis protein A|nr:molybdenum cofactor guanylyltransferase [Syntrophus sp. (in: bacteria)]
MGTGIILTGGKNKRMGTNKAFLSVDGERLIDRTVRIYRDIFDEIILVTNEPHLYYDIDVTLVTDLVKDKGPLMGIYTGLFYAASDPVFFAACDMPFLSGEFIRYLLEQSRDADIVVPETADGFQPLHAVYSKSCMGTIQRLLLQDKLKVTGFYKGMKLKAIDPDAIGRFDPDGRMFLNVNTPEEYEKIR